MLPLPHNPFEFRFVEGARLLYRGNQESPSSSSGSTPDVVPAAPEDPAHKPAMAALFDLKEFVIHPKKSDAHYENNPYYGTWRINNAPAVARFKAALKDLPKGPIRDAFAKKIGMNPSLVIPGENRALKVTYSTENRNPVSVMFIESSASEAVAAKDARQARDAERAGQAPERAEPAAAPETVAVSEQADASRKKVVAKQQELLTLIGQCENNTLPKDHPLYGLDVKDKDYVVIRLKDMIVRLNDVRDAELQTEQGQYGIDLMIQRDDLRAKVEAAFYLTDPESIRKHPAYKPAMAALFDLKEKVLHYPNAVDITGNANGWNVGLLRLRMKALPQGPIRDAFAQRAKMTPSLVINGPKISLKLTYLPNDPAKVFLAEYIDPKGQEAVAAREAQQAAREAREAERAAKTMEQIQQVITDHLTRIALKLSGGKITIAAAKSTELVALNDLIRTYDKTAFAQAAEALGLDSSRGGDYRIGLPKPNDQNDLRISYFLGDLIAEEVPKVKDPGTMAEARAKLQENYYEQYSQTSEVFRKLIYSLEHESLADVATAVGVCVEGLSLSIRLFSSNVRSYALRSFGLDYGHIAKRVDGKRVIIKWDEANNKVVLLQNSPNDEAMSQYGLYLVENSGFEPGQVFTSGYAATTPGLVRDGKIIPEALLYLGTLLIPSSYGNGPLYLRFNKITPNDSFVIASMQVGDAIPFEKAQALAFIKPESRDVIDAMANDYTVMKTHDGALYFVKIKPRAAAPSTPAALARDEQPADEYGRESAAAAGAERGSEATWTSGGSAGAAGPAGAAEPASSRAPADSAEAPSTTTDIAHEVVRGDTVYSIIKARIADTAEKRKIARHYEISPDLADHAFIMAVFAADPRVKQNLIEPGDRVRFSLDGYVQVIPKAKWKTGRYETTREGERTPEEDTGIRVEAQRLAEAFPKKVTYGAGVEAKLTEYRFPSGKLEFVGDVRKDKASGNKVAAVLLDGSYFPNGFYFEGNDASDQVEIINFEKLKLWDFSKVERLVLSMDNGRIKFEADGLVYHLVVPPADREGSRTPEISTGQPAERRESAPKGQEMREQLTEASATLKTNLKTHITKSYPGVTVNENDIHVFMGDWVEDISGTLKPRSVRVKIPFTFEGQSHIAIGNVGPEYGLSNTDNPAEDASRRALRDLENQTGYTGGTRDGVAQRREAARGQRDDDRSHVGESDSGPRRPRRARRGREQANEQRDVLDHALTDQFKLKVKHNFPGFTLTELNVIPPPKGDKHKQLVKVELDGTFNDRNIYIETQDTAYDPQAAQKEALHLAYKELEKRLQ